MLASFLHYEIKMKGLFFLNSLKEFERFDSFNFSLRCSLYSTLFGWLAGFHDEPFSFFLLHPCMVFLKEGGKVLV